MDNVDDFIKPFIEILKDNSWYLKALDKVNGKVVNGRHGRQLGKWLAIESEAMVKLYTTFIYKELNDALRKGKKLSNELKAMKEVLDNALAKLPAFNQKGQPLLRSAYFSERDIKKLFKEGEDFIDKGFMSTTRKEEALVRWLQQNPQDNVIFKVYGKNGKLIEKASYKVDEFEVLFKSNTTFVVEKVNKIDHPIPIRSMKGDKIFEIILKEK